MLLQQTPYFTAPKNFNPFQFHPFSELHLISQLFIQFEHTTKNRILIQLANDLWFRIKFLGREKQSNRSRTHRDQNSDPTCKWNDHLGPIILPSGPTKRACLVCDMVIGICTTWTKIGIHEAIPQPRKILWPRSIVEAGPRKWTLLFLFGRREYDF